MTKNIVITGAGIGLGRALARRFAADGDNVILLGRTPSNIQAVADEIGNQAVAITCDVSSPVSVREAFNQLKIHHSKIDALINNAAIFEPFLVENAKDEQIINAVMTNLAGPMFCVREAIPLMVSGSHIINISSESVESDMPHLAVYQSTKAGLERFTESLVHELEEHGIRVSTVRAGSMFEEGKTWNANPEDQMAFAKAAMERGIKLVDRPLSQFASVTDVFRALIDLQADLHATTISLRARKPS